jgi:very-short-patch-repair endonuclease
MRKTLSVRPEAERAAAPKLQKRGRGWNIAESRLDTLHETAREMRREPTEAQTKLHEALIKAELGKYRFKRQTVIGSAIVDFACQPLKVVVEIDEPDANPEIDRHRDRSLAEVGIKVLRFPAADVLADADAVTAAIVAEMKARWHEQRANSKPRGRPNAGGRYQR